MKVLKILAVVGTLGFFPVVVVLSVIKETPVRAGSEAEQRKVCHDFVRSQSDVEVATPWKEQSSEDGKFEVWYDLYPEIGTDQAYCSARDGVVIYTTARGQTRG